MVRREAAIWATVGAGVIGLFCAAVYQQGSEEADSYCYENIDAYYTWPTVKPTVIKAIQDELITRRECENIKAAYNEAKVAQERRKYLGKYRK